MLGARPLALGGLAVFMTLSSSAFALTGRERPDRPPTARAAAAPANELWAPAEASGPIYLLRDGKLGVFSRPGVIEKPHVVTFSPTGDHAYVADTGNGKVHVVRAVGKRDLLTSIDFGPGKDTHQAKSSPDGRVLLVSRRAGSQTLFKVNADERARTWTLAQERLVFGPDRTPICAVFRRDGRRAYVSLAPSGIAVVDVASMTLVTSAGTNGVLPTTGAVGCGMVEARDRRTVHAISSEGAGHLYRLDTKSGKLTELPVALTAADLHNVALSPDGRTLFGTSRGNDELKMVDLRTRTVDTIAVNPRPDAKDEPDGVTYADGKVYVALRAAGQLAIVDPSTKAVAYQSVTGPVASALPHVHRRPRRCLVPTVIGDALAVAQARLRSNGCSLGSVRRRSSSRVPAGRVISQRPSPRQRLGEAEPVSLVISRGPG